jgi:hypothetical protein
MVYISCMIRTQVYLPKKLYRDVQLVAKQENKPTAEVVRELLEDSLTRKQKQASIGKAFLKLADIHGKGPSDLSANIDKYLYEE